MLSKKRSPTFEKSYYCLTCSWFISL